VRWVSWILNEIKHYFKTGEHLQNLPLLIESEAVQITTWAMEWKGERWEL
jgi:hypothetical protein